MTPDFKILFEMWKTGTPVIELVKKTGMERSKLGKELYKLAGGRDGWNALRLTGAGGEKRVRANRPTVHTTRVANPRTRTIGATAVPQTFTMAENEARGAQAEVTQWWMDNCVPVIRINDGPKVRKARKFNT